MSEKRNGRLPEASDAFEQAILAGGERVRRYERRRVRIKRLSALAAALLLVAAGLGAALRQLNRPRPDPVVQAVDPVAVVTVAPQAQAEGEPETAQIEAERAEAEAEEAEAQQNMLLVPEESGYQHTLDVGFNQDGPFEAGEWAVICGESGKIDNGDRFVGFYERPDAASSRAEMVQGMRAQYLEDAGNGFSKVRFEGMEGYVETKHLAHGGARQEWDESKRLQVLDARLAITDRQGAVQEEIIHQHDKLECYALQKLLLDLEPAGREKYDAAPFGAMLRVTLWDPDNTEYDENGWIKLTERFFSIPRDGTFAVMTEDGSIWAIDEDTALRGADGTLYANNASTGFFWAVFPEAWNWTWGDGE